MRRTGLRPSRGEQGRKAPTRARRWSPQMMKHRQVTGFQSADAGTKSKIFPGWISPGPLEAGGFGEKRGSRAPARPASIRNNRENLGSYILAGRMAASKPIRPKYLLVTKFWVGFWRRVPESNRCTRICNPLRHHSANSPSVVCFRRLDDSVALRKWFCHSVCATFLFRSCSSLGVALPERLAPTPAGERTRRRGCLGKGRYLTASSLIPPVPDAGSVSPCGLCRTGRSLRSGLTSPLRRRSAAPERKPGRCSGRVAEGYAGALPPLTYRPLCPASRMPLSRSSGRLARSASALPSPPRHVPVHRFRPRR